VWRFESGHQLISFHSGVSLVEGTDPRACHTYGHPGEWMVDSKSASHSLNVMSSPRSSEWRFDIPLVESNGGAVKRN
jgi:hypothetical protein